MVNKTSLKAARVLVRKYRALTVEKVEQLYKSISEMEKVPSKGKRVYTGEERQYIMRKYSGMGSVNCGLCKVSASCLRCVYQEMFGCLRLEPFSTNYKQLLEYNIPLTAKSMVKVVHRRADLIEKLIIEVEKNRG